MATPTIFYFFFKSLGILDTNGKKIIITAATLVFLLEMGHNIIMVRTVRYTVKA